jgi:hypothetical protein
MTMTMVGLGWMLTKKITLGQKEGHKNFKAFLKALLRYPKVEREPYSTTFMVMRYGVMVLCFFTLGYLLLLYSKKKMVHSFLPNLLLLYSKINGPFFFT